MSGRFIDFLRNLTAKSTTIDGSEQVLVDSSGLPQKATTKDLISYVIQNGVASGLAQTWNAAGTTFTGLKLNITDTASASGSLLADLQVGGSSQLAISKAGAVGAPRFAANTLWMRPAIARIEFAVGADPTTAITSVAVKANGYQCAADGRVSWTIGNGLPDTTVDISLRREAAGTLAQREGTTAQEARLYGTYTDASNYRRLTYKMSTAGVAELKPEGAGSGASGNVLYISGLPTSNPGPGILWNDAGTVKVGT